MTVGIKVNSKLLIRNTSGRFTERKSLSNNLSSLTGSKVKSLDDFAKAVEKIDISIGWEDKKHSNSDLSYSELASLLENGSQERNIPARPYLEKSSRIVTPRMIEDIKSALRNEALSTTLSNKDTLKLRFERVADKAADKTREIIRERQVSVADNAPSTIARKGFNLPWVETGELLSNLRGKVNINL